MNNIILENGFIEDIPNELIRYCDRNNIEWLHYDMREKFWPENREKTFNFFSNLPDNSTLLTHTVFDGYQQLELMIATLFKIKDRKFNVKIMMNYLCNELIQWYNQYRADITPKELQDAFDKSNDEEGKIIWQEIIDYKKNLNFMFLDVLKNHNIYQISYWGNKPDIHLIDLETIEQNKLED